VRPTPISGGAIVRCRTAGAYAAATAPGLEVPWSECAWPAGCRIHSEVSTTKATNIRHDSASIRNDFD